MAGSAVIAKRSKREEAEVERAIYDEVLPKLPLPSLRCYGLVEADNADLVWLFIEDAGASEFSERSDQHKVLASRWLAQMNTSAASLVGEVELPDRGPDHYVRYLRAGGNTLQEYISDRAIDPNDLRLIENLLTQCRALEAGWNRVREFCDRIPDTLVHGSFVGRNMRVRPTSSGFSLVVFDYDNAGWGIPARDVAKLAAPDIDAGIGDYSLAVQDAWPFLDLQMTRRLSRVGQLFLQIEHIWRELQGGWRDRKTSRNMKVYSAWLERLTREAPWRE
jgi:hypothetical protein